MNVGLGWGPSELQQFKMPGQWSPPTAVAYQRCNSNTLNFVLVFSHSLEISQTHRLINYIDTQAYVVI
jgi:hypothetical protein